jgi:hypothetical protein
MRTRSRQQIGLLGHLSNDALEYLSEARAFIDYEHDPSVEKREFNFVEVKQRGQYFVTTLVPKNSPGTNFNLQTDSYRAGDDMMIINSSREDVTWKPMGLRIKQTFYFKNELTRLELISVFDTSETWQFRAEPGKANKKYPGLKESITYKLCADEYDVRPKLRKWVSYIRQNKSACRVFKHLFVSKCPREKWELCQDQQVHRNLMIDNYEFCNPHLNDNQKKAVQKCVDSNHPISMIHGPPGTGKTTVLIEIIKKLLDGNLNILVCAHSNQAVDNILARLFELFQQNPEQFPYFGVEDENEFNWLKLGSNRVYRDRNVIENFDNFNQSMIQNNTRLVFSTLHGISERKCTDRSGYNPFWIYRG